MSKLLCPNEVDDRFWKRYLKESKVSLAREEEMFESLLPTNVEPAESPLQCLYCRKFFFSVASLRFHKQWHTGYMQFHCALCDRGFRAVHRAKPHILKHMADAMIGKLPFGENFDRELIHDLAGPSATTSPNCLICKINLKPRNVIEHYRLHTGHRPYKCRVCFASFATLDQVRIHCGKHLEETNTENHERLFEIIANQQAHKNQSASTSGHEGEGAGAISAVPTLPSSSKSAHHTSTCKSFFDRSECSSVHDFEELDEKFELKTIMSTALLEDLRTSEEPISRLVDEPNLVESKNPNTPEDMNSGSKQNSLKRKLATEAKEQQTPPKKTRKIEPSLSMSSARDVPGEEFPWSRSSLGSSSLKTVGSSNSAFIFGAAPTSSNLKKITTTGSSPPTQSPIPQLSPSTFSTIYGPLGFNGNVPWGVYQKNPNSFTNPSKMSEN